MHEFLATTPFDLYELYLFHLVVKHRSFTKAAEVAGLTQSAITRQMQALENALGLDLLERTTRSVRITPAGDFLFQESAKLIGDVEQALRRLREEFAGARKEIRVGVSRTVGLAHLPGFFHANIRRLPNVVFRMAYQSSVEILAAIEAHDLDVGVVCPPARLPRTVRITHRFEDVFTLIAPATVAHEFAALAKSRSARQAWIERQSWITIDDGSNTGRQLRRWFKRTGWRVEPTMQLDSFDLIINLVALGMGVSFVPRRALALYGRKRSIQRIALKERFSRQLVVVVRKHRKMPEHLKQFVDNVLF